MLKKIKENIGWIILKGRLKKFQRQVRFHNFSSAKSVGVIFNATHQSNYENAKSFIELLKKDGLKAEALGFVDSKQVLDFYTHTNELDFFSKKNLNWFGKPNNPNTQAFIEKPFNILIDLTLDEDFPVQYIVALSNAEFKVGAQKTINNFYDFRIDLGENPQFEVLSKELIRYINMIKI
ncbi:MAG: hypothetical protein JXR60_07150 [Bacteroidales bacterium]|nr:hypothetical protein [Bacteroidales bacterium]